MIDKDDAQKQGFNTLNCSEALLRQRDELFQKLKAVLPGLIDSDNILNIRALEDAVDLSDTTSNNQGYELTFAGKGLAKAKAEVPTDKELKVEQGQSKNFDSAGNVVIRGDNLDVLKILKQNYTGKVKCIYIDPPYNTENDGFVYSDNFRQSEEQLIADFGLREETVNFLHDLYKTKTHSGWLAFMYPRLKLARQLLTEDGVIFISIDDKEQANLKILCDEIFGEDNFVANFIWNSSTGGGLRSKHVNFNHEYILCYAQNKVNLPMLHASLSKEAVSAYDKKDDRGIYREKDFAWKNDSNNKNQQYFISCPDGIKVKPKTGYLFRFIESQFQENLKSGYVVFKETTTGPLIDQNGSPAKWNIYIKKYLGNGMGAPLSLLPKSVVGISNLGTAHLENLFGLRIFNNPKSLELMDYLITTAALLDNDIVLDFFAGSGTTGEAVMRLNAEDGGSRKFILVQWDEKIPEDKAAYEFCKTHKLEPVISSITLERLRRAGTQIEEERRNKVNLFADNPLNTGFKVFSLATRREITEENGQYTIANAGILTPMDRLYNLLAASCQPLDTPIEEIEKDILYKGGEAVYILGKPQASLEKYKNLPIYVDGYADISLEQFLNLTADEKENVRIVY